MNGLQASVRHHTKAVSKNTNHNDRVGHSSSPLLSNRRPQGDDLCQRIVAHTDASYDRFLGDCHVEFEVARPIVCLGEFVQSGRSSYRPQKTMGARASRPLARRPIETHWTTGIAVLPANLRRSISTRFSHAPSLLIQYSGAPPGKHVALIAENDAGRTQENEKNKGKVSRHGPFRQHCIRRSDNRRDSGSFWRGHQSVNPRESFVYTKVTGYNQLPER